RLQHSQWNRSPRSAAGNSLDRQSVGSNGIKNLGRELRRRRIMQKAIRAFLFLTTATLFSGPMSTRAQEKPKADDKAPVTVHPTPLKVQIVFTEFEGDKKVKSMPYTSVFTA